MPDEELVALVARGREEALGELYDRFGSRAYGLALRIVRDAHLAEDVVSESFLAVWRAAPSFVSGRGTAQAWLLTIVHRRAVDLVRRQERRRFDSLDLEPESESASDSVEPDHSASDVRNALSVLPLKQRRVIALAYYGGYTQSEIARLLDIPLGTVKSRCAVGLARLRSELEGTPLEQEREEGDERPRLIRWLRA